jgi:hypothetical protein
MRNALLILAVLLIIVFGVWEGLWTGRWTASRATAEAAARVTTVPLTVGEWIGTEKHLDPRTVVVGEIAGYLLRDYTHRTSGKTVRVLLICGSSGPTSLHPPETCFQGAGYAMIDTKVKQPVPLPDSEPPAEFWVARFQQDGPTPDPLRLYWSWSANGTWNAAVNPRWTFGGSPFLYKLYVSRSLTRLDEPATEDPTFEFLQDFLPKLHKSLF